MVNLYGPMKISRLIYTPVFILGCFTWQFSTGTDTSHNQTRKELPQYIKEFILIDI